MNPMVGEIKPRWYPLSTWDNKPLEEAKVLMSFELLTPAEVEAAGPTVPSIVPATTPMTLELTTLGLRDLASLLGIHKTMIQFETPNGKRYKTTPSSTPTPQNPNFLQVLKIPLDLPLDRIYAPSLDFEVRDYLFGGMVKRVIGAAALGLGDFLIEDKNTPGRWYISDKPVRVRFRFSCSCSGVEIRSVFGG
jgi:hypothetical protein